MQNKYFDLISSIQPDKRTQLNSVLIIDGLNAFLRAFTMINHINPDGHHIGALTGFLKSIGYAIKMLNPTKVVIVFDGVGGSNARRNLFPDYKANRNANRMTNYSIFQSKEEESESINNQMQRLIQYLQCLPVSVISIEGLEADDIIGYLTYKFEKFEETKEINIMIRITWKSFPKEDTKWRTIKPQHAGLESYMQARHDGFKPSPQNLV